MFEFFEKVAKGIGFKLIDNFSDKVEEWIKGIFENCQNASSGDNAQNASSGDYAQNASSGDYAQNASSGYNAQNASSGYNAKNASSGDNAQNASSGDYAKNASSGDYAQNASSGDYAKNVISGKNSICFDCGYKGTIKAAKGTWIALAEYKRDNNDKMIPVFAKVAQVGNKEYTDVRKRVLKSNAEYILWNKEFCEVVEIDGIRSIILSEKKRDNIKIIKAVDIRDIYRQDKDQIEAMYIATEGKISAHGYTVREAIDDLTYKKLDNVDSGEIIAEIKRTGKVTRSQYRALTGACSFGTNKFCEEHNIQDLEEIEISELRKILINDYGAERFWDLIDNN